MMLGKLAAAVAAVAVLAAFASAPARTAATPGRPEGSRTGTMQDAVGRRLPAAARVTSPPASRWPEHARARLGTTRLRHEFYVATVAFRPDGKVLASTGWDGTVRFWDVKTGEPMAGLPGIEGAGRRPLSVAYSPDGTRLAIGRDSTLQLWDLTTGEESFHSGPQKGGVREIVFSPDGRTLATAGQGGDPAVQIWDAATGQPRRALTFDEPLQYNGRPMSFSPDGRRLAVGATAIVDSTKAVPVIGVWDLDTDARPMLIRGVHGHTLVSLAFAPDGKALISGGCDSRPPRDLRDPGRKLELSPRIRVWDAGSGRPIREFEMRDLAGHCSFTVTRDGRTLVSLHPDRLIVWDLVSAKAIRTIPIERYDPGVGIGGCLAVSSDGQVVAAARGDYTVHLWELGTGKPLLRQDQAHQAAATSASVAPDGRLVATGDEVGVVLLWDAARGACVGRMDPGEHDVIYSVGLAPDGRTLATAGRYFDPSESEFRGIVRLWHMPGGPVQSEYRFKLEPLRLAYSADGRQLAIALREHPNNPPVRARAAGENDRIRVYDTATGRERTTIPGRQGTTYALAFGADGRTLAAIDADETLADTRFRMWDLATGRTLVQTPIEGHRQGAKPRNAGATTRLCALDMDSGLATVATGATGDDRLIVWDLGTGKVRRTFHVDSYQDAALALSPDGRFLAAALKPPGKSGRDTTIRIWEIATKREVVRLEPRSGAIRLLAFTADGKTLVSGMSDTTIILWNVSGTDRAAAGRAD